jgi:uracil-DNA glycosylase
MNGVISLDEFRIQNGNELMTKLNKKILTCSKCNNDFCHKIYLGNTNAKVLIINDNATNDSDVIKYYYDILNMSELDIDNVIQVYAVSCITTRKDKDSFIQRLPSKKECNNCKEYLNEIIDIVKPKIIISLGATALNQFKQGSNLLEHVETTQYFNGIPTLINFGSSDLFKLNEYKTEEEMDTLIDSVINTFDKAAKYIKEN